uniref:cGMP-dependent protein kinase n=1 Tax=Albugo laibachii Nc14 TaxID=890382 RepID=F0WFL3_9STRA|nr:cGMPdependent protein kinase putative [Albugo laibachii Nc14]CCA23292.1 cGMPdependent protein kinase putative [Albugo laibachii Nc14]|eukprot:CCA23292.1 cGMPdependent protein kinase putative [Albugo laibachii Nc14]
MGGGISSAQYALLKREIAEKNALITALEQQLHRSQQERFSSRSNASTIASGPLHPQEGLVLAMGSPADPIQQAESSEKLLETRSSHRIEMSAEVIHQSKIDRICDFQTHPKAEPIRQLLTKILHTNVLFTGLSSDELFSCLDAFFPVRATKQTLVLKQGDPGDHFYAVESGTLELLVSVPHAQVPIRYGVLTAGMGFGELALLCNMPRAATIRAITDVELWALERNTFREITAFHKLQRHQKALAILTGIPILKKLTLAELQQMASAMEWEEYPTQTVIIRQGEIGKHFFIITFGEILVTQKASNSEADMDIRTLKAGDHFGEMALLKDEMRSATCTASSKVQCLKLGREHFIAMLGTIQELAEREPVARLVRHAQPQAYKYHVNIPFHELEILQTLGRGAFGRVKLVRHVKTQAAMALKCVIKARISQNNIREHVLNEKRVMLAIDHPFAVKLLSTFQDARYLYFLVELVLGGELYTHVRRQRFFEAPVARFYIASIILVLEHLHQKSIAYRDIKPENILLDTDGFVKLADFGLAKVLTNPTWTLCGTPDYLAPEMILSKGHGKAVDYWALGVLIYELLAGKPPFPGSDPMHIYPRILQGTIKYPNHFSRDAIDLIHNLLCANPARRLGNMKNGIRDIIQHEWFDGFQWEELLAKKLHPPIIPQIRNQFDTSNFEDFRHHVEDSGHECAWDPDF